MPRQGYNDSWTSGKGFLGTSPPPSPSLLLPLSLSHPTHSYAHAHKWVGEIIADECEGIAGVKPNVTNEVD